jgi:hypothetical protein
VDITKKVIIMKRLVIREVEATVGVVVVAVVDTVEVEVVAVVDTVEVEVVAVVEVEVVAVGVAMEDPQEDTVVDININSTFSCSLFSQQILKSLIFSIHFYFHRKKKVRFSGL